MARIVAATTGSYGDLYPFLAVGKSLAAAGHNVVIAAAKRYQDPIQQVGLEFAPLRPDVPLDDANVWASETGFKNMLADYLMPSLRDSYNDLERAGERADLIISHVSTPAAPVYAEKKKKRWLSVATTPRVLSSRHEPLILPPTAAKTFFGISDAQAFTYLRHVSGTWCREVGVLRNELGLPTGGHPLFKGQHSPFGVLAFFPAAFCQPKPDWPPRTTLCGFPFRQSTPEDEADIDPELRSFIKQGPAPIVVSLGSSAANNAREFYSTAIQACADLEYRAVILCGGLANALRSASSKDILVLSNAPHSWLFSRSRAVVHHAGMGTVAETMRCGKPAICFPFAHDQFDNAARIERLGLGRMRGQNDISLSDMKNVLAETLSDPCIAQRAHEFAASISADDFPEIIRGVVEGVLRQ